MASDRKVLLLDLDLALQPRQRRRAYPNLALMKLSAWEKGKGAEIFLNTPLFCEADTIYASCVFSWNGAKAVYPRQAIVGGPGLRLKTGIDFWLPFEIEHTKPDYDLYPGLDYSMGFTSRGCIRKCPWCKVSEIEGGIKSWASIYEFWDRRHRKIVLEDNNLLAASNWKETLEILIAEGLEVDFNQGLDIRLVTDEVAAYLSRVKAPKFRFAFDDPGYEKMVWQGYRYLTQAGIRSRRLSFYVLYGFQEDDGFADRMRILKELNVDVYPMAYKDEKGCEPRRTASLAGLPAGLWHGPRNNILKALSLGGRLPR